MTQVKAEVAGSVWKIVRQPGDAVQEGEDLIIIESMKMEIPVESPVAGAVSTILVAEGDVIAEGQVVAEVTSAS